MKWIIYLYPKKWRERYEDEFLYILEKRNISFKEVIDIFINAMDARLLNLVEVITIMADTPTPKGMGFLDISPSPILSSIKTL